MARKYKDNKYNMRIQDKVIIDLLQALSDFNIYDVKIVGEVPVTKLTTVTHTILQLRVMQKNVMTVGSLTLLEKYLTTKFRLFDKNLVLELSNEY